MKPVKAILTGLALLLPLANTSSAPAPSKAGFARKDGLSLTVRLDKKAYRFGDDITLSFTLKNESQKDLYIGDGYLGPQYQEVGPGRHFELYLTDDRGARLCFWSDHLTEGPTSGIRKVFRLKPGETYKGSIYLIASGRRKIKVADIEEGTQSGTLANIKTDRKHVLGKDGKKYTLTLVYRVDPETHGVWQPPREFKAALLWQGALKTSPLAFEVEGK